MSNLADDLNAFGDRYGVPKVHEDVALTEEQVNKMTEGGPPAEWYAAHAWNSAVKFGTDPRAIVLGSSTPDHRIAETQAVLQRMMERCGALAGEGES